MEGIEPPQGMGDRQFASRGLIEVEDAEGGPLLLKGGFHSLKSLSVEIAFTPSPGHHRESLRIRHARRGENFCFLPHRCTAALLTSSRYSFTRLLISRHKIIDDPQSWSLPQC